MKRELACAAALALMAAACEPADKTAVVDSEHMIVRGHKITLHQLDAPDKDGKCDEERALGAFAEDRLNGLLLTAKEVEFQKTGMACLQFMDCDGFVRVDGKDVGDMLIEEGLAVRDVVQGSGEAPHDWCKDPAGLLLPGTPEQEAAPPETPAPT